tara:strand:- start:382 stop:636 length:255 start_codon:yes stop_codon:yes gene_type:complete
MPKGKGYTEKQIQAMRDEGVLSPAEIENLLRGNIEGIRQRKVLAGGGAIAPGVGTIVSLTPKKQGAKGGTRRSRSQGYKYFPDN